MVNRILEKKWIELFQRKASGGSRLEELAASLQAGVPDYKYDGLEPGIGGGFVQDCGGLVLTAGWSYEINFVFLPGQRVEGFLEQPYLF